VVKWAVAAAVGTVGGCNGIGSVVPGPGGVPHVTGRVQVAW
jgi:hypothetical protein